MVHKHTWDFKEAYKGLWFICLGCEKVLSIREAQRLYDAHAGLVAALIPLLKLAQEQVLIAHPLDPARERELLDLCVAASDALFGEIDPMLYESSRGMGAIGQYLGQKTEGYTLRELHGGANDG
jgi:hypothetical protein